jgi:hypothetical protein
MSNPSGSGVPGEEDPRKIAKDIADQLAALVRR